MGDDLGGADNQPLPTMVRSERYKQTDWTYYMRPHTHVFACDVDQSAPADQDRRDKSTADFSYALSPVHVNYVLFLEALVGNVCTPEQAAQRWRYRGVNMTPTPAGLMPRNDVAHRALTVVPRADYKVDNFWGNVQGTDHCFFAFKRVKWDDIPSQYKLSVVESQVKTHSPDDKIIDFVTQIVAVKSPHRTMSLRFENGGVVIPVYVGMCIRNIAFEYRDASEESEFECSDAVAASKNHIDMLILSN